MIRLSASKKTIYLEGSLPDKFSVWKLYKIAFPVGLSLDKTEKQLGTDFFTIKAYTSFPSALVTGST